MKGELPSCAQASQKRTTALAPCRLWSRPDLLVAMSPCAGQQDLSQLPSPARADAQVALISGPMDRKFLDQPLQSEVAGTSSRPRGADL